MTRLLIISAAFLFLLAGCGGGNMGSSVAPVAASGIGTASFTVNWPPQQRLIPNASQSIVITINHGSTQLQQQTLKRPSGSGPTTANFTLLPVESLTVTATAYPNTDGTGIAQATATVPLTIEADKTVPISITMNSTIVRLALTPNPAIVVVGQTQQMSVGAYDAANAVVLLSPPKLQWKSSNTSFVKVGTTGIATGVEGGSCDITVTDSESGKSAVVPVTAKVAVPLLISDHYNYRLVKTDDLNTVAGWSTIGTEGSGLLQFQFICAINVDSTGRIYMTDADLDSLIPPGSTPKSLSRIARMDNMSGAGWVTFGSYGSGVGQFNQPADIYPAPDGYIYIADMGNNRIIRINDMSGAGWTQFGTFGTGVNQFHWPNAITMDSQKRIYIVDNYNSRIVRINDFSGDGWTTVGTYASTTYPDNNPAILGWDGASGIALDSKGRIYVSDSLNARITRMDDMDPTIARATWVSYGSLGRETPGPGYFWWPTAVKIDHNDRIYVADELNNRVVTMNDMTGAGWSAVGTKGSGVNQLNDVWGVALP